MTIIATFAYGMTHFLIHTTLVSSLKIKSEDLGFFGKVSTAVAPALVLWIGERIVAAYRFVAWCFMFPVYVFYGLVRGLRDGLNNFPGINERNIIIRNVRPPVATRGVCPPPPHRASSQVKNLLILGCCCTTYSWK